MRSDQVLLDEFDLATILLNVEKDLDLSSLKFFLHLHSQSIDFLRLHFKNISQLHFCLLDICIALFIADYLLHEWLWAEYTLEMSEAL